MILNAIDIINCIRIENWDTLKTWLDSGNVKRFPEVISYVKLINDIPYHSVFDFACANGYYELVRYFHLIDEIKIIEYHDDNIPDIYFALAFSLFCACKNSYLDIIIYICESIGIQYFDACEFNEVIDELVALIDLNQNKEKNIEILKYLYSIGFKSSDNDNIDKYEKYIR
jgi:hypothetical protein